LNIAIPDLPNQFSGGLYGLDRIGAPEAWSRGYTGQGIVVAVCDTGVDRTHPDLDGNIWTNTREVAGNGVDDDGNGFIDDVYGWNFASGNNNTLDVQGHGTHVSGTIAGENNGFGVTGVAYGARIMPVKVLGDSGSGSVLGVANGIRYAADNGAHVINLSLGASVGDSNVQSAVQYAWNRGVAVIMAAGNDGASRPGYPAAYANNWGIAVGAIDSNGALASFSNRAGTTVLDYVTAAGVNVYSTLPGNRYASNNGTSMATPNVAGAMALLIQANRASGRNLSIAQLEQLLTSTASNFGTSSAGSGTTTSGSPGALVAATDLGGTSAAPVESAPGSVQTAPDAGLPASSSAGADATSTPAVASNFAQAGSAPSPGPSIGSSELGRDASAVESASTTATGSSHSWSNPGQAVTMPLGVLTGRSRAGRSGLLDPLTGLLPSHWRSA
jgi:subtilisin family serine protease